VLAVLTFGILVGQRGAKSVQVAVIAFLLACAAGLFVAGYHPELPVTVPLLAVAAVLGVLVAVAYPLPLPLYVALGAMIGVLLGTDSGQAELDSRGRLAALIGSGIAVYLLALYVMAFTEWFSRHAWQRVGLRVLGSWSAAAALLVLSLNLSR
jgi:urease accessory protein